MKRQNTYRFIEVIRLGGFSFSIKGISQKRVDSAPSKYFIKKLNGKYIKIWIVKISGKKHKNAGKLIDLPNKYRGIIAAAIREGIGQ